MEYKAYNAYKTYNSLISFTKVINLLSKEAHNPLTKQMHECIEDDDGSGTTDTRGTMSDDRSVLVA